MQCGLKFAGCSMNGQLRFELVNVALEGNLQDVQLR
jgi:hypothetical protein